MSPDSPLKQAINNAEFVYTSRPDPLAGDLRMSWVIAILIMALFFSRGKKSNLQKLQFLAHSVRVEEGREEVRGLFSGLYRASEVSVRVEPSLNRAIAYAHALGLIQVRSGTSVALTSKGELLAKDICAQEDAFSDERTFLREIAPKTTDVLMKRIWRLEHLL